MHQLYLNAGICYQYIIIVMAGKKRSADQAWGDDTQMENGDENEMVYAYDRPDKVQKAPPRPEHIVSNSEFWGQVTKDIHMHCADQY